MKTMILYIVYVAWIALFMNDVSVCAGCSHRPTIIVSPSDGSQNFDDADRIGGFDEIDKIVKIEVYVVDALFRNAISKIDTTYLRTDGQTTVQSHGNGGRIAGTVEFDNGQYLSKIELLVGVYVEHIRLCRTDGVCFGPYGFHENVTPNRILYKQRCVIKALLGKSGDVVDRIRVYYESDKIYNAELGEIVYETITPPTVISDVSFLSPEAVAVVDNFGSSVERSSLSVMFAETVSTYETTVITKSKQLYSTISFTKRPDFLVQLEIDDVSTTFTMGTSFSPTLSEWNTKVLRTLFTRNYTVTAPPFSLVTGEVYYRQIKYAYDWTTTIQCYYTFDPDNIVSGGTLEGHMYGTQAFPNSYVKLTEQFPLGKPPVVPLQPLSTAPTHKKQTISQIPSIRTPSLSPSFIPFPAPSIIPSLYIARSPTGSPSIEPKADEGKKPTLMSKSTKTPVEKPIIEPTTKDVSPFEVSPTGQPHRDGMKEEKDDNLGLASFGVTFSFIVLSTFGVLSFLIFL
jgi:hypothetical protein